MASRDRSRSPLRPVSSALSQVALGIVSNHERAHLIDNAETIIHQQRATISSLTRTLRQVLDETREESLQAKWMLEESLEAQLELVEDQEILMTRIRALETEVAELRARTQPQCTVQ